MSGIKVTGFRGKAPKTSPELLPEQSAQIARNCKLYSGDLIPYPEPVVAGSSGRFGSTETIYALRNPSTNDLVWLSWDTEVNVATPSYFGVDEQRFYYTGDGVPKVSTYDLAVSGTAPYPNDYYELGLPLPETKPTISVAAFDKKSVSTFARDAGNIVTIVTTTDHDLKTGNNVAVSGFTYLTGTYSRSGTTVTVTINGHNIANGSTVYASMTSGNATDGVYTITVTDANTFTYNETESGSTSGNIRIDLRSFNTTGSEITVIDDTTFSYYSPGFEISAHASTEGKVDLSGQPLLRSYVYTWYTPWDEESIGSDPSESELIREAQVVTVSNLPTAPPLIPQKNFIRGIRLYRTLASATQGQYFRLATLWFPHNTATLSRTSNVVTVVTQEPHNFIEDDRFKLANATTASFNITGGIVTEVVDPYTFKFAQAGVDVAETSDTTGILYHDAAENTDNAARYWGDSGYDFVDDFDPVFLTKQLTSDEYEAPPPDLTGIKVVQNNILVGFTGKKLLFSEPDHPHAWPSKYEITLDYDIVGVEPVSGLGMIVMTKGYPYLISGSDPDVLDTQRIDSLYPCVSSKGIVSTNFGIAYPTHSGLAVFSASGGMRLFTEGVYEQDTWSNDVDPETIVATFYEDAYFAAHSGGGFVFRYDQATGGQFVDCDVTFDAVWPDRETDRLYYASGTSGTVYEWDSLDQPPQQMEWKSKVIVTQDYINLGAARVIADYGDEPLGNWEDIDTNWEDIDTDWEADGGVVFKLFVNKQLIFTKTLYNSAIFRLPTGYRADTFEYSITSKVRIRAVHMAETPIGLKEA